MAEAYLSQEDLNMRLDGSICMYDGHPYYVRTISKYPNITLYALDGKVNRSIKGTHIIDHTGDRFSDRSPLLGYITYNNNAHYLSRIPFRHQNQGLTQNSIDADGLDRYESWFFGPEMEKCILGKHASVEEAWKLMDRGYKGVSIHRQLAIKLIDHRNIGLYYKTRLVATWDQFGKQWEFMKATDGRFIEKIVRRLGVI